eukprot:692447-Pleurochrysis_carterae.AAC.2
MAYSCSQVVEIRGSLQPLRCIVYREERESRDWLSPFDRGSYGKSATCRNQHRISNSMHRINFRKAFSRALPLKAAGGIRGLRMAKKALLTAKKRKKRKNA